MATLNDILTAVQNVVSGINNLNQSVPTFVNNVVTSVSSALMTRSSQGGQVTQTTNIGTAVTLNSMMGQITTVSTNFSAGTIVQFLLNNSFISSADVIAVSGAVPAAALGFIPFVSAGGVAGSVQIGIDPLFSNAGSSVALTINFAVIKSVIL